MSPLTYIVEPEGLLLLWQPAGGNTLGLTRRIVGKILVDPFGVTVFRYLRNDEDFAAACSQGFQGFPAFDLKTEETREGVVAALLRRLPPRGREDFDQYLAQHGLPTPFPFSDLALLAYTGARLPSDGFCVVPVFPAGVSRCDYVTEVAGLGYTFDGDVSSIQPDDQVQFFVEPSNQVDQDAVAIYLGARKLGFVNRGLRRAFNDWIEHRNVSGYIFRVNGSSQRPRVFVRVNVR
jgi:hypothetical protein